MTRVNLVEVDELTDQHLVAERLELTWVIKSARSSLNGKKGLRVHPEFVLGPGHVSFFHDKLGYIIKRFNDITQEMNMRRFNVQMPLCDVSWVPPHMMKDYTPTPRDYAIIKARIRERLLMKPEWYRYYGKPLDEDWINEVYK